jgi:acyl-CoA thioester hydrolase
MSPTSHPNRKSTEAFSFPVRVYYEDTDAGGIVYHANYLKFAERGRTEYLRAGGWDHQRVEAELGLILIVCHIEIDYRAPSKLDDLLNVQTVVAKVGRTSLTLKQTVLRANKVLAEMEVVVVAVTPAGKPVAFPPQLRQIFEG